MINGVSGNKNTLIRGTSKIGNRIAGITKRQFLSHHFAITFPTLYSYIQLLLKNTELLVLCSKEQVRFQEALLCLTTKILLTSPLIRDIKSRHTSHDHAHIEKLKQANQTNRNERHLNKHMLNNAKNEKG